MRKFRKSMALLLAMAMVLSTFGITAVSAAAFNDTSGHWAEGVIDKWSNAGVVNGYEGGAFLPDASITRAELAKVISTAQGYQAVAEINFTDVSENDWFAVDLAKCVAQGVIGGYEDGTFRPDNAITREEAATMFQRAYKINAIGLLNFTDNDAISEWAKTSVTALVGAGVINGYGDGTFAPGAEITRAEVVKILDGITTAAASPMTTAGIGAGTNTVGGIGHLGGGSVGGSVGGSIGGGGSSAVNTAKVVFYPNGGVFTDGSSAQKSITVTKASTIGTRAPEATRSGYVFDGWYTSETAADSLNAAYKWDVAANPVSVNTTLYAGWYKSGKAFVKFVTNGGTPAVRSQLVESGGKAVKPDTELTRPNYTFVGWYTSNDASAAAFDFDNTVIKAETKVYARWQVSSEYAGKEAVVQTAAIGSHLNGRVEAEPASAIPGETIKLTVIPPVASDGSVAFVVDYLNEVTYTSIETGMPVNIAKEAITENEDGTFSFVVPADAQGTITVNPHYKEVIATPAPTVDPNAPDPTEEPYVDPNATPEPTPVPAATERPIVDPTYCFTMEEFSNITYTDKNGNPALKANTEVGGLTSSKDATIDDSSKSFEETGTSYSKRLKVGTATLSFKVTGPCEIRIDAASASSADREYEVMAGSTSLGSQVCMNGDLPTGTFYYTGSGAETIKIVPKQGINVYGIFVAYGIVPPGQTQAPATQAPATQAPATQAPATQAPATQAPATQAPATQAPSGEKRVIDWDFGKAPYVNEDGSVNTAIFPEGTHTNSEGAVDRFNITADSVKDADGLTYIVKEVQENAFQGSKKEFDDGYNSSWSIKTNGASAADNRVFTYTPSKSGEFTIYATSGSGDKTNTLTVSQDGKDLGSNDYAPKTYKVFKVTGVAAAKPVTISGSGNIQIFRIVYTETGSEAPATQAPATQAPATEAPATGAPATSNPQSGTYKATLNVTGGKGSLSGDGLVQAAAEGMAIAADGAAKPGVNDYLTRQQTAKAWIPADNYQELYSMISGTGETKFDILDMNMDNLLLRSSTGSRPINYEDMEVEQGKPATFSFPDGSVFPSKILNFRPGTEMEFFPNSTKAGKLRLYYHTADAPRNGSAMVKITQGADAIDGVVNEEFIDETGEYGSIVVVDVKAYDTVIISSLVNAWLTAVSYTPEGDTQVTPTAPPAAATPTPVPVATTEYMFRAGSTVSISTTPDNAEQVAVINVTAADGSKVEVSGTSFVMPEQEVTVDAVYVDASALPTAVPTVNDPVTWDPASVDLSTEKVDPAPLTIGALTIDPLTNTLAATDAEAETPGAWSLSSGMLTGSQNPKGDGRGGIDTNSKPAMGTAIKLTVALDGDVSANISIGKAGSSPKVGYVYEYPADGTEGVLLCEQQNDSSDAALVTDLKFKAVAGKEYYIFVAGSKAKFGKISFTPSGAAQ